MNMWACCSSSPRKVLDPIERSGKTGELRHSALLPIEQNPDSLAIYLDFLANDHEQIHVMRGVHQPEAKGWLFERERKAVMWPKTGNIYPADIE
jgi:hypothetical protein